MSPSSRPVKLACLACRASKIRCDGQKPCASCSTHQEQCRYQPSRRGGARRGPTGAEELARKRTQRPTNEAGINNDDKVPDVHSQGYHHHSHTSAAVPFPPSLLSSVNPDPSTSPEDCSIDVPSPLGGIGNAQELLEIAELPAWSIRAYRCDQDLINAYYIFIHPYFPFLPPPAVPQCEDKCVTLIIRSSYANASIVPYWPTSPLGLALAAMLALIPPPGTPSATEVEAVILRRSYADLYARSALESLEDSLESSSHVDLAKDQRSNLHPAIPRKMESVLALSLLSLYECCQCGNIPKMRVRANQALAIAMDLSLHTENSQTDCLDAHRRCWWATIFLVYLSSIMKALPPIITFDDLRITTLFPEFRGCREPWPLLVNSQAVLLRSCFIGRQLVNEHNSDAGLPSSLREDIQNLDSLILELAAEVDRFRCVTNYQGAEADASRNLWAISNAFIHTSRLTLHRVRVFLDRPVFLDEHCDFLAIDTVQASRPAHHFHLSTERIAGINALFPFTEQESARICLQSSLVVSRVFRRLPSPNPTYSDTTDVETAIPWASRRPLASPRSVPYMARCQLHSFYTLAMVLWHVRTAMCSGNLSSYSYLLDRPSATTEVQDAERLMEELQSGMEALAGSIQADVIFEGVGAMAKKIEGVYEATLIN